MMALAFHKRVEVVYMGCYGRRGPRVTHFGRVAKWALSCTPYQVRTLQKQQIYTKKIDGCCCEDCRASTFVKSNAP